MSNVMISVFDPDRQRYTFRFSCAIPSYMDDESKGYLAQLIRAEMPENLRNTWGDFDILYDLFEVFLEHGQACIGWICIDKEWA